MTFTLVPALTGSPIATPHPYTLASVVPGCSSVEWDIPGKLKAWVSKWYQTQPSRREASDTGGILGRDHKAFPSLWGPSYVRDSCQLTGWRSP